MVIRVKPFIPKSITPSAEIFLVDRLVTVALVIVALIDVKLLKAAESELSKLVTILLADKFVEVEFVIEELLAIKLLKAGLSVKEYVTFPNVSVATLKFVDEAKYLYKFASEVVATTPFIFVVRTELFSAKDILLELIKLDVASSPFTIEVIVFTAEFNEF